MEFSLEWNSDDFASFLCSEGIHDDVAANVISNRVTSALFVELNEDDLKELAPAVGDRIALRKILERIKKSQQAELVPPVNVQVCHSDAAAQPSNTSQPAQTSHVNRNGFANASEWHIHFSIPELNNFSQHVKNAVNSGAVTQRARKEIYQILRTYITAFTNYPSPEQYTTICRKLIEKYPALKDDEGTTKWFMEDWTKKFFENFRRVIKNAEDSDDNPVPAKCPRLADEDLPEEDLSEELSDEEYDDAVKELQELFRAKRKKGKGSNHSRIKELMDKTKQRRCKWIRQDPPPLISQVLEKFPHLQICKWVRREFKSLASSDFDPSTIVENWLEWRVKLIQLAQLESATRPLIRKLLRRIDEFDELQYPEDAKDFVCLELLNRLLYTRKTSKQGEILKHIESCELDLDEEISKVEQSEPFIVVTSKLGSATSQIFICCEGEMFLESKSMRDAIVDLMSVYYVFDISYPKPLCAMMIFLQHHVFSLEDQQTVPPALKTLISNLQKM